MLLVLLFVFLFFFFSFNLTNCNNLITYSSLIPGNNICGTSEQILCFSFTLIHIKITKNYHDLKFQLYLD